MATVATNLRRGMAINYKGDLGSLLEVEHRSPGKGAGFVQVIMRSFASGKSKDIKFAASEKVDIIDADRRKLEFSYSDSSGYFFMDPETYETIEIAKTMIGDMAPYLVENLGCDVVFVEENPVTIELPPSVEMEVTEASEGLKGDTANNPQKPITVATGLVVQGPLFIKIGDRIKIDTKTGKYTGRA